MKYLAILLLILATPAYAQQMMVCFDKDVALKAMTERLHQPLIMGGIVETGDQMMMFADIASGKWTIAIAQEGKICFVADGTGLSPVSKDKDKP